jgi:hypothetical protein
MRVAGRRMFTGILRDISDRVSAEERHRAIVETASTGSSPSPPTARCTR